MIKIFVCGRCNQDIGTRNSFRKHLREEHLIKKRMANTESTEGRLITQRWWKWREFK